MEYLRLGGNGCGVDWLEFLMVLECLLIHTGLDGGTHSFTVQGKVTHGILVEIEV